MYAAAGLKDGWGDSVSDPRIRSSRDGPRLHFAADRDVILFDLDGVLVDSFDVWAAVLEACRARHGLPPLGRERIQQSWGQGMDADAEEFFPGVPPAELAREYAEEFGRHVGRVRVIPGAVEAVAALRLAGKHLAVVTNSPVDVARALLTHAELDAEFRALAGGDEVPRSKPDPALLHLALERLGAQPRQAVLVGDTEVDVAAGRAARLPVIGYRVDGDLRIEHLTELPGVLGAH